MLRTHTCGELNTNHIGEEVILCGWVQRTRDFGGMTFLDLRDRYGITQLVFNMEWDVHLCEAARKLSREYVIRAKGKVTKRESINPKLPTGEIEIIVDEFEILNESKIPPFTIEDQTDGGEELRMKYRYLDLRRNPLRKNLEQRHALAMETRKYLCEQHFLEIETPYLIKSTPEGARDFVVPSRMNPGQFYALPQSPQTLKQILMVAGYDRYFQIVRCFRDEDLRADRQPEFTQIDCEMAFVDQEDILQVFEGLIIRLFSKVKGIELDSFPRISYDEAMKRFGSDKPDIRFGMEFTEITSRAKGKGFKVFDEAEIIVGINAKKCAQYSRKELDQLTEWVKRPQIGASGLIYIKFSEDGSLRSSIDKFFRQDHLRELSAEFSAKPGDLMLIIAGAKEKTLKALGELRLEMGNRLGLRNPNVYRPLWVIDFPLLEWDEELQRFFAMHHPFTSPKPEDIPLLETNPSLVRANAYDLVINGVEIGGGSIRIHLKELQNRMLRLLGFTQEEAQKQFGFLMDAFEYGAPPHGGIAFGFDRLCAIFGGSDSIRDFIAFPKNNSGRDMMLDSPSEISQQQLNELYLRINLP
ncbi:MAG TPA: aspartate--tRNA ligase [Bacteroidales bacterium]|jgi:aspartyl-tRNA synthetase|nr:MAG: Aspartate--tRNA ligase [Bacteroidetes bacterium ADurb.Bin012]HNQ59562.1 aspartate--tRNA ligase [Bacteroidales bacterium]HNU21194.1 aspartate--tRNA ligase [Bacteroidales bacterium]HNV16750.1 aspartate--tRNA ligase [Bacteroidales bacterium]HNZ79609.1 aspartate--tRNA ligase [Bacteroidales bacterium]